MHRTQSSSEFLTRSSGLFFNNETDITKTLLEGYLTKQKGATKRSSLLKILEIHFKNRMAIIIKGL